MITCEKCVRKLSYMSDADAKIILHSLASNVCNGYMGSLNRGAFKWIRTRYGFYLTTDSCDDASPIRVYLNNDSVKVTRIGEDVEDWVEVMPETQEKIVKCLLADNK